jgi:hypothetical protein
MSKPRIGTMTDGLGKMEAAGGRRSGSCFERATSLVARHHSWNRIQGQRRAPTPIGTMVMLDTISWSRDHDGGVAYAQPPLIVSSAVFDGGKGTRRPRPLSWSVRRGRGRWGIKVVAWRPDDS